MVTSLVDGSLSEGQSRSFYNPSTRSKLKSFEDLTHKTKLKFRYGDTVTVLMNPELVFRRELVLANCFQFTSVVVDIFDRYDIQNSIKKAERDR